VSRRAFLKGLLALSSALVVAGCAKRKECVSSTRGAPTAITHTGLLAAIVPGDIITIETADGRAGTFVVIETDGRSTITTMPAHRA